MGGICQAPLRRTGSCVGIPRPLYPPCRHQQPTTAGARERSSLLSVYRLPRLPPQGDDCAGGGIHPPLSPAQLALRFPAHSLLRLPGQLPSRQTTRTLSQPPGQSLFPSRPSTHLVPSAPAPSPLLPPRP